MKQKDIAAALGISTSTVSRVLSRNDTRSISDEVKHKIIAMAFENGIKIKTRKYGILVGSHYEKVDDPYFAEIVQYAAKAFGELSYYRSFLCNAQEFDAMSDAELADVYGKIDGLIIIGVCQKDAYSRISRLTKNIVCINEMYSFIEICGLDTDLIKMPYDYITYDCYNITIECVRYLAGMGRRKIIYVGGIENLNKGMNARYAGYSTGMIEAGMEPKLFYTDSYDYSDGNKTATRLYKAEPFDAVICHNDKIAVGFMERLQSFGVKIPDDVMIVGFDDISLASYTNPQLTTVKVDVKGIGYMAAMIINAKVEGIITERVTMHSGLELIKRKSTGGC